MGLEGTNLPKEATLMIPVHIHSLGLDEQNNQPVLMLREDDGHRIVPIWIGHPEAMAIMLAVQGIEPPRPLTHDLMMRIVGATGFAVDHVEITRVQEGTFFASIVLRSPERAVTIDARPSDSLALAVRSGCPVLVDEDVMLTAGIVPEEEAEQEVAAFRDFLDHVEPDDFGNS
jgi:bifunctional DNase/RNase